jgi:hypothetical protein
MILLSPFFLILYSENVLLLHGMKNPRFSNRGFMLLCVVLVCLHEHEPAGPCNTVFSSAVQTYCKPPPMDNFDHYTMTGGFRR